MPDEGVSQAGSSWDALAAAEQEVLAAAAEESQLAELCQAAADRPGLGFAEASNGVRRLVGLGLVGLFWRDRDGAPDLDAAECEQVCAQESWWSTPPPAGAPWLYLTGPGETLYYDGA